MSQLSRLIDELCPAGVEHLPVCAVAEYSDTRTDAVKLDAASFVGVDNLLANWALLTDPWVISDLGGRVGGRRG